MMETTIRSDFVSHTSNARRRIIDWLIGLLLLAAFLWVLPRWADPNQNSRLDMVVAVVDDGTFRIDRYVANTVDYARIGDEYYSDKAPGAAFLGIPIYAAARPVFESDVVERLSERLNSSGSFAATLRADGSGIFTDKVRFALVQVLLAALVGAVPTALAGVLLWRLALRVSGNEFASVTAALAYGLASPVFAYGNSFYGHQLTAFLLVAAFALILLAKGTPGPARLVLTGVLLAYAVVSEYPALLPAGILYLYTGRLLLRAKTLPRLLWTTVAGLVVAAGWMTYNTAIFGGPLSLGYANSELWTEQHSTGFMSLSLPTWDAAWGITFGPFRGLFVLAPWLLLALPGFVIWFRGRRLRTEWWVVLGCTLSMFLFNASSQMWWGGFAVGPRYLLPALPFLALASSTALAALLARRWGRVAALLLILVSAGASWAMALAGQAYPPDTIRDPWQSYVLPAWRSADIARNLGTLLGLRGLPSILPLLLLLVVGIAAAFLVLRPRRTVTVASTIVTGKPQLHA